MTRPKLQWPLRPYLHFIIDGGDRIVLSIDDSTVFPNGRREFAKWVATQLNKAFEAEEKIEEG